MQNRDLFMMDDVTPNIPRYGQIELAVYISFSLLPFSLIILADPLLHITTNARRLR